MGKIILTGCVWCMVYGIMNGISNTVPLPSAPFISIHHQIALPMAVGVIYHPVQLTYQADHQSGKPSPRTAEDVEKNTYNLKALDSISRHNDKLGKLSRFLQVMAEQV
jgi:hypothetical protein